MDDCRLFAQLSRSLLSFTERSRHSEGEAMKHLVPSPLHNKSKQIGNSSLL